MGAIIKDESGRLLLIQRGHEPEAGRWSLPGGRIEPGESDEQAVVREIREETGLRVICGALVGSVERPGLRGAVVDIRDYAATVAGGTLAAGDDAADARWVSPADLAALRLTSGLAETLAAWGVLGQPEASRLALIAEATKRAGLIWITVPGYGATGGAGAGEAVPGRPRAAWHVWRDAAYVLTGPGEQDVPGLGDASQVTVTVPSKDTGGLLVRWTAQVSRVEPGSAEWPGIIGALLAARLNEPASPGEPPAVQRWTQTGAVYRLSPASPFEAGCDAPSHEVTD